MYAHISLRNTNIGVLLPGRPAQAKNQYTAVQKKFMLKNYSTIFFSAVLFLSVTLPGRRRGIAYYDLIFDY